MFSECRVCVVSTAIFVEAWKCLHVYGADPIIR